MLCGVVFCVAVLCLTHGSIAPGPLGCPLHSLGASGSMPRACGRGATRRGSRVRWRNEMSENEAEAAVGGGGAAEDIKHKGTRREARGREESGETRSSVCIARGGKHSDEHVTWDLRCE